MYNLLSRSMYACMNVCIHECLCKLQLNALKKKNYSQTQVVYKQAISIYLFETKKYIQKKLN